MESIINYLPKISYIALVPSVLIFLKMGIDTFNITKVEKAILTDSKKIAIHLSRICLFSLFYSTFFFAVMLFDDSIKDMDFLEKLILFCLSYILVFLMVVAVYPLFLFLIQVFSFKENYYFKDKDENIEWKIVRRVDKNKLLVLRKGVSCKFINANDIINKEITAKLDNVKTKRKSWIYQSNKKVKRFQIFIVITTFIWMVTKIWNTNQVSTIDIKTRLIFIALIIVYCSFLLHYYIVKNNDKLIKRYPITEDNELIAE
ncbi:hypothetical protein [Carnobacterium sp. ISL-102]|uniref:hypothetical protein n=1 Tax=Carnobacterium sp. ISL-102 TaxID=2819142 RepID=UPI001BE64B68|nr:hypothetical protein [Carnobacterium sp. ISL-102]MBT2732127.1 hypothetical protein [Carnobacterium sp. ISL-102]